MQDYLPAFVAESQLHTDNCSAGASFAQQGNRVGRRYFDYLFLLLCLCLAWLRCIAPL